MSRQYGSPSSDRGRGGVLAEVDSEGPFGRAGIESGASLVAVDGIPLSDVLDWQWRSDGTSVDLLVRADDGEERNITVRRAADEPWGVCFEGPVFDGVRTCRNNCAFCFMSQLPTGLRPSLYLRDDDYRLSFLNGNFITLTNLTDADVDRIVGQRLSPLYVSLHAVDPDVRRDLVCAKEDRALERFDQLVEGGVELHVQVVLVPGVNDGERLDETLTWLAEREGVSSVGIVPLGYTGHQERFSEGYEDAIAAAQVIAQVQRWQFAMRERDSVTWAQLADEFYLNARAPFPTTEWYDGFPQYENGIGMVRAFADEASALRVELSKAVDKLPESDSVTIVTSMMAATTLAGALGACEAAGRVRLLVVPNRFFGGNVSVTGLLTGRDLTEAIQQDGSRGTYLIPDVVFNCDHVTLDEMSLAEIAEKTGADLRLVSSDAAGLLEGLEGALENPARNRKE